MQGRENSIKGAVINLAVRSNGSIWLLAFVEKSSVGNLCRLKGHFSSRFAPYWLAATNFISHRVETPLRTRRDDSSLHLLAYASIGIWEALTAPHTTTDHPHHALEPVQKESTACPINLNISKGPRIKYSPQRVTAALNPIQGPLFPFGCHPVADAISNGSRGTPGNILHHHTS